MKKILTFAAIAAAIFVSAAASYALPAKDSEYDPYGNTCKPEEQCTFYRKAVLPGGINVSIQAVSLGKFRTNVEGLFDYSISEVTRVARLLDENDPDSDISKINAHAGKGSIEMSPELSLIVGAAKKCHLWTRGAFDITATPEIGNFNQIKISGDKITLKKSGMKITLSNIIHGYLSDLVIRAIYNAGIDNALVEVGPTSRSIGKSVAGNWRTEVNDNEGRFAMRGMALDTSNVAVGYVLASKNAPSVDPRWATPITPQARSVTIISRNAAISQAIAYGVYVMGPDAGMPLVDSLVNVKAVIIDNQGNFIKSPGI